MTCSVTETRPNESSTPRHVALVRHGLDEVSVSFFGWVYQSPEKGWTSARRGVQVELPTS